MGIGDRSTHWRSLQSARQLQDRDFIILHNHLIYKQRALYPRNVTKKGHLINFLYIIYRFGEVKWLFQGRQATRATKITCLYLVLGFPAGSDGKGSTWNAGDPGWIPGSGQSHGKRHGCPLQYSSLENSMDRGAWWAIVHGAANNPTRLSNPHKYLVLRLHRDFFSLTIFALIIQLSTILLGLIFKLVFIPFKKYKKA